MMKEGTSPQIKEMVGDYLKARNDKNMVELYTGPWTRNRIDTCKEAQPTEIEYFVERRILKLYVKIQHRWYKKKKSKKTAKTWATGFIENMI